MKNTLTTLPSILGTTFHTHFPLRIYLMCAIAAVMAVFPVSTLAFPPLAQAPTNFTVLHNFVGSDGVAPGGTMAFDGTWLYGTTPAGSSDGTLYAISSDGASYHILHYFFRLYSDGTCTGDGTSPADGPTLVGSQLFGVCPYAGDCTYGYGTLYSCDTTGSNYTLIRDFLWGPGMPDYGIWPISKPINIGGFLFGTTDDQGGVPDDPGEGTVFCSSSSGSISILHAFNDSVFGDGTRPAAGLTAGAGSPPDLYGATEDGGTNGGGTIFAFGNSFSPSSYRILHDFGGDPISGPRATLLLDGGTLYGTACGGDCGIFKINTNGTGFSVLYDFGGPVILGPLAKYKNKLYGALYPASERTFGQLYSIDVNGSNFTTIYEFTNLLTGAYPGCGLTLATNTTIEIRSCCPGFTNPMCMCLYTVRSTNVALYGTTMFGGISNCGTIFRLPLATSPTSNSIISLPSTPASGSVFSLGTPILLSNNICVYGSGAMLDYYVGSTHLATVTNCVATFAWTNAPFGTNTITALLSDTNGEVVGASVSQISVVNYTTPPQTLSPD